MARPTARSLSFIDLNFIGTALVIAAIGCMLIYSATYFTDPSLDLLRKQILWIAIGVALMIAFISIDYHVFFDIAPFLYGIGNVLLVYLLVWGRMTANVRSWIHFGAFQFQPAEFMKIFTALMLARYFDNHTAAYLSVRSFMHVMFIVGLPVALIFLEPDLGTAASYAPLIAVALFFGGVKWRVWVVAIIILAIILPIGWMTLKPYQKDRIVTFLNPDRDPLGKGYQVTQAKIAIGSGGIHGKGFKQGTQAKYGYLPAKQTDFIFSVLGEEWGFIGVIIVLALYLFLIVQALLFAKHARDRGGTFLAICLISFFIFHVLINVSMQIGLLPTTGIPLPLISYGGSQTMMFLIAVGLLANIDMRRFGAVEA
ncbi:MAG TPA: rod shape-determining protein RodA [Thermoanaerobaculia bacterium]|nr:rod shape-determining protein RodA [Thermoanaerobaculia bacterium]